MRCPSCSSSIPDVARYCPRCGQAFEADAQGKPEWNRMKASVPASAWLLVVLLVVAPLLVIVGAWMGVKALLVMGALALGFLVLLILLGMVC